VQGISTRSVDEPVKSMGMSGIGKSQVSRLCTEIEERVNASRATGATYLKVREAGRIVSVALGIRTRTGCQRFRAPSMAI
jgi:putative transposase